MNSKKKETAKGARGTLEKIREGHDKAEEAEKAEKSQGAVAIDPRYLIFGTWKLEYFCVCRCVEPLELSIVSYPKSVITLEMLIINSDLCGRL